MAWALSSLDNLMITYLIIHIQNVSVLYRYTRIHVYINTPTKSIDQLCSKANEVIIASRTIRGEIKPLVVSVQASKTEAHGKIQTAISESVEQAKLQKVKCARIKFIY